MNSITKIIIAGTVAALSATAAQAQTAETRTMSVRHADLDLSNQAGQKTLALRIHRAATMLCTTGGEHLDGGVRSETNKCRTSAVAQALGSLRISNASEVAAYVPTK